MIAFDPTIGLYAVYCVIAVLGGIAVAMEITNRDDD